MVLVMGSSDSFHQGLDMGLSPSVQKQLCNKYSRLSSFFPNCSDHCQILQKETLMLRGYKLLVSPARERKFEVLERQQNKVLDLMFNLKE